MTISTIEQGAGGTDLNTVAALRTVKPASVIANNCVDSAAAGLDCLFAHPFVAHARAPLAQNATLGIVGYNRRQIPFGVIILFFSETFFEATPVECHLLQFALTAPVAYRTIQRVVRE